MSKLCLVLFTYNRLEYAKRTIEAFYMHVSPKPHLHIADDGSPKGYVEKLVNTARKVGAPSITTSNSERGGYGRNVNVASQTTHALADYVFALEDDWACLKPLSLVEYVGDLDACGEIDCIRLGYLSATQPLWGQLLTAPNHKYMRFFPDSPEPHVFAGHPRLERVSFQRRVGEWPEGLLAGETEFSVAHRPEARHGVVWPLGLSPVEGSGYFSHIGTLRADDA